MTLQEAYEAWTRTAPLYTVVPQSERVYSDKSGRAHRNPVKAHWDGECCSGSHSYTGRNSDGAIQVVPKPDSQVCERERTWRAYTRIRDGIKFAS